MRSNQAGHGLGCGRSGFVLVLLALEFVERRAIGAVLRGLGHAALGRDLRAEVAWLHEHDVNAKRRVSSRKLSLMPSRANLLAQ